MKSSLKSYAYVLECSDNKYYVGIAYNLQERLKSHFSDRGGSVFTKIYKPIKCIATYDLNTESRDESELIESLLTIHYAKIYGYENVAGGNFCVRDTLQRKRSIEKCIQLNEIQVHTKKYKMSDFNLFEKITEIDFVFEQGISDVNQIAPYEFDFIYDRTEHIQPLKKRLLIILALIYRKKVSKITKIKLSCINRSDMTIDIPLKHGKFINRPMEEGLLKLIELYYRNETNKPIDYLFMGKTDNSKSMGITDENYLIEEIKKSL